MIYNIAIDGPAGAGKSTIAKLVAKKKNYIYIDTGAMYRSVALYFIEKGIELTNYDVISKDCGNIDIKITYENDEQVILLNGENVNGKIRQEEVGKGASVVSQYKEVRELLVSIQRSLAKVSDVVMDGRDIGTVVLPDANVKVYLTASSRVRALRRYNELIKKGEECDLDLIEKDIIDRDYRDMHREISPLTQAEDAILIDSSDMTIEEVADKIISLCK